MEDHPRKNSAAQEDTKIQILIQIFMEKERFSLDVEPSETFENIMAMIQDKEGIDPRHYRLCLGNSSLYGGSTRTHLARSCSLSDYNIEDKTTIILKF